MANKYKAQSREAQKRRRIVSSCWRKRPYETEEEAKCKGFVVYKCKFCKKYHRAHEPGYRKVLD